MALVASNGLNVRAGFSYSAVGRLGNAERSVLLGANGLKTAMRAMVAYADDPTPSTLARMKERYQDAAAEWNSGVRTVWSVARRSGPPTV